MIRNFLLTVMTLTLFSSIGSAQYVKTSFLDYFLTKPAGACTAGIPGNQGTYYRGYQDSQGCSGLPRYQVFKGAGSNIWSTESFILQDGQVKILDEIMYSSYPNVMTYYRTFRDMTANPPQKGVIWAKVLLPGTSDFYTVPDFDVEYWTDGSGQVTCNGVNAETEDGGVRSIHVYKETWSDWLQDRRSVSQNPNVWHDVDVFCKVDNQGTFSEPWSEKYCYGRWTNPANGKKEGLGLVLWRWVDQYGNTVAENIKHYLVDCAGTVACTTCPP